MSPPFCNFYHPLCLKKLFNSNSTLFLLLFIQRTSITYHVPRIEARGKSSEQDTVSDLQALEFRDGEGQESHCNQTWQIGKQVEIKVWEHLRDQK